jgi:hypothetical protein
MSNQLMMFGNTDDTITPLPLLVARQWGFPLQYHNVEETLYYSVQDWLRGLLGQTDVKATVNNLSEVILKITSEKLSYIASDGKTYKRDFVTDKGLYFITQHLRSTQDRPAIKAIKEYLAKAGAFTDALRINSDAAQELAKSQIDAKRQVYLDQGKSEAWIETRIEGLKSRRAFTDAIKQVVTGADGQLYGKATNTVYSGVLGRDANTIREELGLSKHAEVRDHMHRIGLHYVGLVEAVISTKLEQYGPDDPIPPVVAIELIRAISKHIGASAQEVAKMIGLDIVTGQPLLGS